MKKKFKVLFFQVDMGLNRSTFADLLQRIQILSPEERTAESKNLRLDKIEKDELTKVWYGTLTKIRMDNLPEKMNHKTGESSDLLINDDEGIAEMSAFLFDPEVNLLLVQRSTYGPSETAFSEYFHEKCTTSPIAMNIILKRDVLEKLRNMQILYKFECKMAKPVADVFVNDSSVTNFLNSLGTTEYADVEIILSADKSTGLASWIKKFATLLSQNITGRYKRLKVGGISSDGTQDFLDLLQCKKEELVEIERDSFRTISFTTRKNVLKEAYSDTKEEMYEMYKHE